MLDALLLCLLSFALADVLAQTSPSIGHLGVLLCFVIRSLSIRRTELKAVRTIKLSNRCPTVGPY